MAQGDRDYRKDITGLRAIALAAVLTFHFEAPVPAGFIGVDIFFVVSGYVITQLLLRVSTGRDIARFYWARTLRIVPPIAAVSAVLLAGGYVFLAPREYADLGTRVLAALGSYTNILLYLRSGDYFAPAQLMDWLLHLWSLALEAQFYLVYPAIVWLLRGRPGRTRAIVLALLCLASLAACIWQTPRDQVLAFYGPHSRAWEFMAGGLAALCPPLRNDVLRRNLHLLGLILLGVTLATFTPDMGFPGHAALLPVLGTALLLACPARNALLLNPLSQALGTISYSVYLWHWPVVILARHLDLAQGPAHMAGALLVAIVLGAFSWLLVERPARRLGRGPLWSTAAILVIAVVAVTAASAYVVWIREGLPQRVPDIANAEARYVADYEAVRHTCFLSLKAPVDKLNTTCLGGDAAERPQLFIWGDSYALALTHGFIGTDVYRAGGMRVGSAPSCPALFPSPAHPGLNPDCPEINRRILQTIRALPPRDVLLYARWRAYGDYGVDVARQLPETVAMLRALGSRVIVVGVQPEWQPSLPQRLVAAGRGRPTVPSRLAASDQPAAEALDDTLRSLVEKAGGIYIPLLAGLCDSRGCLTMVDGGARTEVIVYDHGHLTFPGSDYIRRTFLQAVLDEN